MFPILNISTSSPFLWEITAFLDDQMDYSENNVFIILGKDNSVSSFLRPSKLCKDNSSHAGLDDDPNNTLYALHDDGLGTLLRRLPGPVPDGVLGLHTEQEGGGKVLVCEHTRDECSVLHPQHVVLFIVPVEESNEPPDEAKDEPGDHEAGKEGEESVAPLEVQDGREHVLGENDNYSNNISTDS